MTLEDLILVYCFQDDLPLGIQTVFPVEEGDVLFHEILTHLMVQDALFTFYLPSP